MRGIEVEMILMIAVRVRPENGAKWPASGFVELLEDAAFFAASPSIQDRQSLTVLEAKTTEIDRIAFAVLGHFRTGTVVACPARIVRCHLNPCEPSTMTTNRLDQVILDPVLQRLGGPAVQNRRLGQVHTGNRHHTNRVLDTTARQGARNTLKRFALDGAISAQLASGVRGRWSDQCSCEEGGETARPKSGAAVS